MRILVTGATGFVGQHLLRLLASRRNQLFGTFLNGDSTKSLNAVELMPCDLRDAMQVSQVIRAARPHQVYHLAALSSVRNSFQDSRPVYEANFLGTLNLLEALRAEQPSVKVLLVSSGHIYGAVKRADVPIKEDHPLLPDTPYGVSKAAADLLGAQFFQSYGMHVIRARPFNHTGPGQSDHFVCSDFARQFAAIEDGLATPIVTVGNIRAARDFSDVRDVVHAYRLLLRHGRPGEAYNVCSGRAVRLQQILRTLKSFTRQKVEIRVDHARVRAGEADIIYGTHRKLSQATGWHPRYRLEDTLRDLFLYWRRVMPAS